MKCYAYFYAFEAVFFGDSYYTKNYKIIRYNRKILLNL